MTLKVNILHIVSIILSLCMVKSHPTVEDDELTLRNQLFADVFLLKEGVDRLQISVEVLNKRSANQIDVLKEIHNNFKNDREQDVCYKLDGFTNSTNQRLNSFELKILSKLLEVQDEQTTLLNHIKLKANSTKMCSIPEDSTEVPNTLSPILSDLNKKVAGLTEKLTKLEAMEEIFKSQQLKLDQFNEDQMKMLQNLNAKLTKNQENFERFEKEMPIIKNMLDRMDQVVRKEPPKIPMSILLGLTNANLNKS